MSDLDEMTKDEPGKFTDTYGLVWEGKNGLWEVDLHVIQARVFRVIVPTSETGDRIVSYVAQVGGIILTHAFRSPRKAADSATQLIRHHLNGKVIFNPPTD